MKLKNLQTLIEDVLNADPEAEFNFNSDEDMIIYSSNDISPIKLSFNALLVLVTYNWSYYIDEDGDRTYKLNNVFNEELMEEADGENKQSSSRSSGTVSSDS